MAHQTQLVKRTCWRPALLAATGMMCLATPSLAQSQIAKSAAEFSISDSEARHQTLVAIAKGTVTPAPANLTGILSAALAGTEAKIRREASELVASKAGATRSRQTAEGLERWRAERPALIPLTSRLQQLVRTDKDSKVRISALLALVNLDYAGNAGKIRLRSDLASVLVTAYDDEQDTLVRTEIVKSLALCELAPGSDAGIFGKAMFDVQPGIVQYALIGMAETRNASLLPQAARFVTHRSAAVRMTAAQAISRFGSAAAPYVVVLRNALVTEQDDVVRKTLQGAINVITKR